MGELRSSSNPHAPLEVFYAYSHKDERLRDKLETHLSILKRSGTISGWHHRRISAGMGWTGKIDEHLNTADIILLLVSADFIASDYCYDKEVMRAMERHESGEARVIPVILRPCDWQGARFAKLQGLPRDMKAVTSWASRDEAFKSIAVGIRKAAEELRAAKLSTTGKKIPQSVIGISSTPGRAPRTSAVYTTHRAGWKPDSNTLSLQGPHIEVLISKAVSQLQQETMASSAHEGLPIRALIDTGASITVINPQIAATCELLQTDWITLATVGGTSRYPAYAAAISFPGKDLPAIGVVRVVACPIVRQPYFSCLIGRDILRRWRLKYDGLNGELEIRAR